MRSISSGSKLNTIGVCVPAVIIKYHVDGKLKIKTFLRTLKVTVGYCYSGKLMFCDSVRCEATNTNIL
jgi:hypothetical protein